MKPSVLIALMLCAACTTSKSPSAPAAGSHLSSESCGADKGKFLVLDFNAFDQDMSHGWREVADKPGCRKAAADLIAAYRDEKLQQWSAGLDFHEAQLRAAIGETDLAIRLFERNLSFKKQYVARVGMQDVLFTQANIDFLKQDRRALLATRAGLAALPKPTEFDQLAAAIKAQTGSTMTWPLNLQNVDALIACFGQPYSEAMNGACRAS